MQIYFQYNIIIFSARNLQVCSKILFMHNIRSVRLLVLFVYLCLIVLVTDIQNSALVQQ
jgi:hypothetical protein